MPPFRTRLCRPSATDFTGPLGDLLRRNALEQHLPAQLALLLEKHRIRVQDAGHKEPRRIHFAEILGSRNYHNIGVAERVGRSRKGRQRVAGDEFYLGTGRRKLTMCQFKRNTRTIAGTASLERIYARKMNLGVWADKLGRLDHPPCPLRSPNATFNNPLCLNSADSFVNHSVAGRLRKIGPVDKLNLL